MHSVANSRSSWRPVRRDRDHAQRGEQPVLLALVLEHLLDRGQDLGHRPARQDHRAPGHSQAHAEGGLLRPAPTDVTHHGVYPAAGRLHQVVEVPAEQRLPATGLVPGGDGQPSVGQQRRGQQPAFQPGVLPRDDLRLTELALDLLGAAAFHRIPDDPVQQRPVHLALHQIVLGSGANRFLPQVLVGPPGQHDHRDLRQVLLQPAHPLQLMGIRQAQVEQHTGGRGQQWPRLGHRPRPLQRDGRGGLGQQLLDQEGVAVVILDQQHLHTARRGSRDRRATGDIVSHCPTLFLALVNIQSPWTTSTVE
jgi:hypothetical protein